MGTTLRSKIAIWMGVMALLGAVAAVAAGAAGPSPALGLLVVALSPLLGWLAGRAVAARIVAPLERLGVSARTFASGNLAARADVDSPRETRIVAEAFNQIAGQINAARDELKREEHRKTQFVSDVSHVLRTPLTAIRGAAETLLDGDVEPEDQQRFLSTIALEAERLGRLANDLLTLQRIEGATGELPIRPVDLRLAADRAAAMLEPLLEDREVTLSVNGRTPLVLGDTDRLQQVVANLPVEFQQHVAPPLDPFLLRVRIRHDP